MRNGEVVRHGSSHQVFLLALACGSALVLVATAARGAEKPAPLDAGTAGAGLKEALQVGVNRAVGVLGQLDGYLGNPEVHIPVPEKLQTIGKAARGLGMGRTVEEFETSMNRAAEAAAPLAKDVFVATIKQMTFEDALTIVRGKDHEATDYLRARAGPELDKQFRPIVSDRLAAVGATRAFESLMAQTTALPFVQRPAFDLEAYVTGKALDGMFLMIAREEQKIRKDPLARTSDLLKRVFGEGQKKRGWKQLLERR